MCKSSQLVGTVQGAPAEVSIVCQGCRSRRSIECLDEVPAIRSARTIAVLLATRRCNPTRIARVQLAVRCCKLCCAGGGCGQPSTSRSTRSSREHCCRPTRLVMACDGPCAVKHSRCVGQRRSSSSSMRHARTGGRRRKPPRVPAFRCAHHTSSTAARRLPRMANGSNDSRRGAPRHPARHNNRGNRV
jgi:hypothetical protein